MPKFLKKMKIVREIKKTAGSESRMNKIAKRFEGMSDDKKLFATGVALGVYNKYAEGLVFKQWYKNFYSHANRVVDNRIKSGDWKYWKKKVPLYFKPCEQIDENNSYVIHYREWLKDFWKRVKDKKVTCRDVDLVKNDLIPYFMASEEKNKEFVMKKLRLIPKE